ncbi:MAG: electron transfer flavoprotein subunit beta/FixA family protein [Patescibacteria group bacterium]
MKIVVCVKQVPGTTEVKINPETNTLVREGIPNEINPFDLYALEEALRLRERLADGTTVTALAMGPPQAEASLREAVAMGADEAVLLSDRAFAGADTLATAYTLAEAIRKIGDVSLILCGKQAVDGDTAQVGPEIAENLDLPHLTYVRRVNEIGASSITVERMTDDGYERISLPLPALLTVSKEINEPRLPGIKGQLRAKKAGIPVWTAADLGADPARLGLGGSPTQVRRIFYPEHQVTAEMLTGSPAEQAAALAGRLKSLGVV